MNERKEKFTPGPWKLERKIISSIGTVISIVDTNENTILNSGEPYGGITPENEGDMELIAAAPDMYAALKKILSAAVVIGWSNLSADKVIPMITSALAKARGES